MSPELIGDLENLLASVKHVARGEKEKILSQAEERAEKIRSEAEAKAEQIRKEARREAQARAEQKRRELESRVKNDLRKNFMHVREQILAEVWQKAEDELREVVNNEEETYLQHLKKLAFWGASVLQEERVSLVPESVGHELLGEDVLESWGEEAQEEKGRHLEFHRVEKPVDAWGGLLITDQEQERRVDATFPVRLELAKRELRSKIFQSLIEDS